MSREKSLVPAQQDGGDYHIFKRITELNSNDLGKTVKGHAQNIREIIQGCSTESVVRNCLVRSMKDYLPFGELTSPAKQMHFLLGLLLASEEPECAQEFGISHWQDLVTPLVAAFSAYSLVAAF